MLFFLGGGSRLSHGTQRIRRQHCRQQRDPLARPVQPGCRCGEAAPRPLSPRKLDMPWDGSINGCCNHPHHPLGCVCLSRGHDVLSTLTPAVTGARIFLFSSSFPEPQRTAGAQRPLPPLAPLSRLRRSEARLLAPNSPFLLSHIRVPAIWLSHRTARTGTRMLCSGKDPPPVAGAS